MIDSGPTTVGLESTVLDLTGVAPRVLRPGPISGSRARSRLSWRPSPVLDDSERTTGTAGEPGQMPVHYAPRTPAYPRRLARRSFAGPGLSENVTAHPASVITALPASFALAGIGSTLLRRPKCAARSLYDVLHRCDALAKACDRGRSFRPIGPSGRRSAIALMRACRPALGRELHSNSRRWDSKSGRSSGSGGGAGRFKCA